MALHPLTEGWPCRSKLPAGGSTPPRQRCSLAGRRAGRLQPRLGPEGLPDLGREKRQRSPLVGGAWLDPGGEIPSYARSGF